MRTRAILLLVAMAGALDAVAAETPVEVKRPTVVAFFEPVSDKELEKHPDTNEALADFQEYVSRSKDPLERAGVDFHVVYARSFQVRNGSQTRTFRLGKIGVGYYLVGPGRRPRIEQGVMTDADLFQVVHDYFGMVVR